MDDALHPNMYGAAARRGLAYLSSPQDPPLPLAEQRQLLEYVVRMVAVGHVFNLLCSRSRACTIYELEERMKCMHNGGGRPQTIGGREGSDPE